MFHPEHPTQKGVTPQGHPVFFAPPSVPLVLNYFPFQMHHIDAPITKAAGQKRRKKATIVSISMLLTYYTLIHHFEKFKVVLLQKSCLHVEEDVDSQTDSEDT